MEDWIRTENEAMRISDIAHVKYSAGFISNTDGSYGKFVDSKTVTISTESGASMTIGEFTDKEAFDRVMKTFLPPKN